MKKLCVSLILAVVIAACTTKIDPSGAGTDSKSSLRLAKSEIDKLYDDDSELKRQFGKSLVKSLSESKMLRALIKNRALEQFNEDYEVLYAMIEDEVLEGGVQVGNLIEKNLNDKRVLQKLKDVYPTLTILVPSLPENSFSASKWDINTQIPRVAIKLRSTNDAPIINLDQTESVLEGKYTPGFPVVVVKENERVVEEKNKEYRKLDTRVVESKKGSKFRFLSESFDGKSKKNKRLGVAGVNIQSKLIDAFNIFSNGTGWHRDYIYYNIASSGANGPFDYTFKDGLTSFRMVGDAMAAYQKISDQTGDPAFNPIVVGQGSQWLGGSFEFKVSCLINAKNGVGAQLTTFFPASPSSLFNLEYVRIYNSLFGPDIYGLSNITLTGGIPLNIPIFNWDLNSYSTSIKVTIEEVDATTTTTETVSGSAKFAANFGIEGGALKKIGAKLGVSAETTQNQSYQIVTTQGNDLLGDVSINFADNVVIQQVPFFSNSYIIKEYPTGFYSIGFEPIRVQ